MSQPARPPAPLDAHRTLGAALVLACLLLLPGSGRTEPVSYQRQVLPVLERNCVVCHACYDAPCQLKLGTPEGVDRGANKLAVYDAARRVDAAPTQLFFDASTTAEWREKDFFSVTDGGMASLLGRMIELGRAHGVTPNKPIGKKIGLGMARKNSCPKLEEFEEYAEDHPAEGMPLGVTPLGEAEYQTLRTWLEEGAKVDAPLRTTTSEELGHVRRWEAFLNRPSKREQLVARYLFEHLYLGHLHFGEGKDGRFFQVVRSRTAPGAPIDLISTVRPSHDPGGPFSYRLRLVAESKVHKTHITYDLTPAKMARYQELFLDPAWDVEELPGYSLHEAVNPFEVFAAIPARARYQFMLDDALFFVRNFIRGPVRVEHSKGHS